MPEVLSVKQASVVISLGAAVVLQGDLWVPDHARGLVLFAHGSGSSRHSPRNRLVAGRMQDAGLATLLFDLLTPAEEALDDHTCEFRFDIGLLARRLVGATDWLGSEPLVQHLEPAYFGASTGAAAALVAAAERADRVRAVVCRGGRPDLAGAALPKVKAPTLLIVGGWDGEVMELNRRALGQLQCPKKLAVVPEATHLFEEPGKLEAVAALARGWLVQHLSSKNPARG
ncbi:MAG: hypothetical protein SFU83_24395 [Meiothermus sp.]|nr:hypothetical protein [Meiothermus sp.]